MIFFKANSEDPDETSPYVASHLGLRSLTMSYLCDARIKWVNLSLTGSHSKYQSLPLPLNKLKKTLT